MADGGQTMDGFVKLYRSIEDCAAFTSVPEMMAFAWLVMRAAWRPKTVRYKGKAINLKRGELAVSIRDFSRSWEWSKSKTEWFFKRLKHETMIETRNETGVTVISICKYSEYQSNEITTRQQARQQQDSNRTQNKEGKNIYIPSSVSNTESSSERESTTSTLFDSAEAKSNGFEEFWKTYRRKNDNKASARKAWDKAVRKAAPDRIIEAAKNYIASLEPEKRHGSFQAMAATWLNQERFLDEYEAYGVISSPSVDPDMTPEEQGFFNQVRFFELKGKVSFNFWSKINSGQVPEQLVQRMVKAGYDHNNPPIMEAC